MRYQCYILCLILSLVGLSSSWAEWTTAIIATAAGNSAELIFGEHPEALDGFDSMDVPVPPLPPDGLMSLPLNAVFNIAGTFPRLATDIRQPGSDSQWELEVWSYTEDVILTWNISDIPYDGYFYLTWLGEDIIIDMRMESSLILPRGLHTLTLDVAPEPNDESIKGDVNGDGQVNSNDARLLLQFLLWPMKSPAFHRRTADMNSDGRIRLDDVVLLLRSISTQTAPGKNSIDKDLSIAPDKAQSAVDDSFHNLNSSISPKDKTATTWAAIKVAR